MHTSFSRQMLEKRWGLGIGGAAGNGVAYEGGELIVLLRWTPTYYRFPSRGQVYSEGVFLEDKKAFDFDSRKINRNVSSGNLPLPPLLGLP